MTATALALRQHAGPAIALALVMIAAGVVLSVSAASISTTAGSSASVPLATHPAVSAANPAGPVVFQGESASVWAVVPSTGTAPYAWQWLYSASRGASYAAATSEQCATPSGSGALAGAQETCTFETNVATVPGVYYFELRVTDSASVPESATSSASSTVTVERAPAGATSAGTSAPQFDTDPQEYCSGTCDTTNWFGGTGGSGALVITTASANELLVLAITDSGQTGADLSTADISDTQASTWDLEPAHQWNGFGHEQYVFYALDAVAGSDTITIDPAAGTHTGTTSASAVLSAFSGVDTAAPIAAEGTFETGTGTQSSASVTTGVAPTTILGVVSTTNGASAFTPTSSPAFTEAGTVNDGAATASFVEYYAATGTGTYTSTPTWTGSVRWGAVAIAIQGASPLSVTVAPTNEVLDQDQSVTVSATASGGTGALTYAWSVSSGSCPGFTNSAASTLPYSPAGTTASCVLTVTVTDGPGDTAQPTPAATVVVNSQLAAPATPTPSATALDVNQAETVTGTIPSTGTAPYSWAWLVSVNEGTYAAETHCARNAGTGAAAGATETCAIAANTLATGDTYDFELQVTDSATTTETTTSDGSATVVVGSVLLAPAAPTVSGTKLDVNQVLTVMATIPSTGTPSYGWTWLVSVEGGAYGTATECAVDGGSGAAAGAAENCVIGSGSLTVGDTYSFELRATDSATVPETATSAASSVVTVSSELTAPATPSTSATRLDANQALTVTGTVPNTGTSTYSWQWLVSVNGQGFAAASQCAANDGAGASGGATETCSVGSGTLTPGDTYAFELMVTDSATAAESATSSASSTVSVASSLTAPSAPSASATKLDLNQPLTISGTLPTTGTPDYSWQWLVSVNGAGYAATNFCAVSGGSGAAADASETCAIAADTLTAGDSYAFELQATDSATSAETATSASSATVTVASALTAPSAPTLSATWLDANQALTASGTVPSTGSAPYAWTWLVSEDGSGYATATECAVNSGTGAGGGAVETCSIPAGSLAVGSTLAFELEVSDGATISESATSAASGMVAVSSELTAPTAPVPNATSIDVNQPLSVTGTIPSDGTATYAWQWLVSVNGGTYEDAAACGASASGSGASPDASETCAIPAATLAAGDAYTFELEITDSATSAETATSSASAAVTVTSALAGGAPTPSNEVLDDGQTTLLSANPSGGSGGYAYQWYSGNSPAACEGLTAPISEAVGATYSAGPSTSTYYCYVVVDSDSDRAASTSVLVTVNPALTSPTAPSPSAGTLDANQPLTVTGTIPSTGTEPYSWEWLVSVNGGTFVGATACAVPTGSGASEGAVETCVLPADTLEAGDGYGFELGVTDNATSAESALSPASPQVTVNSALTAPTQPAVSATALDADQTETVTATIPSSGTAPYAWQWMVSTDGGAYVAASECQTSRGSGADGGSTETCSIAAGALTPGETYSFALEVADGSGAGPENQTSAASAAVSVRPALNAPAAPTVSASTLSLTESLTVTATLPTTGTPSYSWQWLFSTNAGAYVAASVCGSSASGSGAAGGSTVQCTVPSGTLAPGATFAFELAVSDSASRVESATSPASAVVTVAAPDLAVGTSQGPVGATYLVSGSGFSASSTVTVSFGSLVLTPAVCSDGTFSGDQIKTDANGEFDCTFTVPSEGPGTYSIVGMNRATSSATVAFSFTVTTPELTVSPTQGPVGTTVTVNGTGFSVSKSIASLLFDSQSITSCLSGSLTTNNVGAFSCTFEVPRGAVGSTVQATDPGGATALTTFTALAPPAGSASSGGWLWIAVAAAVLGVLVIALLAFRRRRATPGKDVPAGPPEMPSAPAPRPVAAPTYEIPAPEESPSLTWLTLAPPRASPTRSVSTPSFIPAAEPAAAPIDAASLSELPERKGDSPASGPSDEGPPQDGVIRDVEPGPNAEPVSPQALPPSAAAPEAEPVARPPPEGEEPTPMVGEGSVAWAAPTESVSVPSAGEASPPEPDATFAGVEAPATRTERAREDEPPAGSVDPGTGDVPESSKDSRDEVDATTSPTEPATATVAASEAPDESATAPLEPPPAPVEPAERAESVGPNREPEEVASELPPPSPPSGRPSEESSEPAPAPEVEPPEPAGPPPTPRQSATETAAMATPYLADEAAPSAAEPPASSTIDSIAQARMSSIFVLRSQPKPDEPPDSANSSAERAPAPASSQSDPTAGPPDEREAAPAPEVPQEPEPSPEAGERGPLLEPHPGANRFPEPPSPPGRLDRESGDDAFDVKADRAESPFARSSAPLEDEPPVVAEAPAVPPPPRREVEDEMRAALAALVGRLERPDEAAPDPRAKRSTEPKASDPTGGSGEGNSD